MARPAAAAQHGQRTHPLDAPAACWLIRRIRPVGLVGRIRGHHSLRGTATRNTQHASRLTLALLLLASVCLPAGAAGRHIGFVDPATPKETPRRNSAALAFARTQGSVTRLAPARAGGWQDEKARVCAPEEFDVLWYHEGDNPAAAQLPEAAVADLLAYVNGGGVLLLSGSAGRLLNDLGIEPTPLRILNPTDAAYASGIVVPAASRAHPAFAGLDAARPVLLTGKGGNALADFYGTAGPSGTLLAEGNAGLGERPLVEYTPGAGRVLFVGWRLADFTTAGDAHRPNLERLFANLLGYLSEKNANRARIARPAGDLRYLRVLGVPFLRSARPAALTLPVSGEKTAILLSDKDPLGDAFASEHWRVRETALQGGAISAEALGMTITTRVQPVSAFVAARRAEQKAAERQDEERLRGLRVVTPRVQTLPAPLKPLRVPKVEQSVLLGRSPFMAPGNGRGDITPVYEPLEDGGFRIAGSTRRLNRPIVHGQNRVWTGDVPIFRMDTVTGNGTYAEDRVFPLWPRPDAAAGNVNPSMGTLRLGVRAADGSTFWLDEARAVEATFRPGYTSYRVGHPAGAWTATVTIAPARDFHGLVCRVEFDRPAALVWRYGGVWWQQSEANANKVALAGRQARITEANLPNGAVLAAWDGEGAGSVVQEPYGEAAEFASSSARAIFHVVATWGVTQYDEERARKTMARLDTPVADKWPELRDRLKRLWFDCYVKRALDPDSHLQWMLLDPGRELQRTRAWWDERRQAYQIRTPDPHLNALMNWARCVSEYHRQGPGLVLGAQIWQMYSHISTGWYGKAWGGDHDAIEECLRLYGALQMQDGFIPWISPSLTAFHAENNTPYWVDQVWRHYTWTGDRQFARELWPAVRKAVAWHLRRNDADGDGLFRDYYEYWNCDSNGKGPKAAAPTAMAWAMLNAAAGLADAVGDGPAEHEYRMRIERTQRAVSGELWRDGRLGSIGADGLWRGHPQTWEQYLAANAGLLSPDQAREAMRWIATHYGFQPQPGVRLLACSDWWPLRWSVQWVPTGDTLLAALAGLRAGDADLWWPYVRTVVGSAFRSDCPGINMGISNAGAGGGDREDVDSDDPHTHLAVRGLFGIEPALHRGRMEICPAFPSDWRSASIRTPDIRYEYRREGNRATFRIHTPRPLVKRVRANLSGDEVVTPKEKDSVVTVALGPAPPPVRPADPPTLLVENPANAGDTPTAGQPAASGAAPASSGGQRTADRATGAAGAADTAASGSARLSPDVLKRQVLFDLAAACNVTPEEMIATPFTFDYADGPSSIGNWWGNPTLAYPPAPRVVEAGNGVRFLTTGRPLPGVGAPGKSLLALSSWPPYPLPAGAVVPAGFACERIWLLLQNYVHPMKNYIPNGEVVLRYAAGEPEVVSLIPPFNLDCYFQHFALQGVAVPMGRLGPWAAGWTPIHKETATAHADALEIPCDPSRVLQSVEVRATCSEGVIGLAGMTAVAASVGE